MMTSKNIKLPPAVVHNYLKCLIGQFYKILPIKESGEPSLKKYINSLQREMIGCRDLITALNCDELFLSLLSILQYLSESNDDVKVVKCEVFKAISICEKLQKKYCPEIDKGV